MLAGASTNVSARDRLPAVPRYMNEEAQSPYYGALLQREDPLKRVAAIVRDFAPDRSRKKVGRRAKGFPVDLHGQFALCAGTANLPRTETNS